MVAIYPSPRTIYLDVRSEALSPDRISEVVGVSPDEAIMKGEVRANSVSGLPAKWSVWRLIERGSSSVDISELIRVIYQRMLPLKDGLKEVDALGCEISLEVVLYLEPLDECGPGFCLDIPTVKLLAEIGAVVDVDQYLMYEEL